MTFKEHLRVMALMLVWASVGLLVCKRLENSSDVASGVFVLKTSGVAVLCTILFWLTLPFVVSNEE